MRFQVFIKGFNSLTIPDEHCSFETLENLETKGWERVWDSAPSEWRGAFYAASAYGSVVPVPVREVV